MSPLPKHIVRTTVIAGGLAVFQAAAVIVVASALLVQYPRCSDITSIETPNQFFTRQLKVHYFQDLSCESFGELQDGIMQPSELYVWLIIIISFSSAWLLASIWLLMVANENIEKSTEYYGLAAFSWAAATAAVVVVDATVGVLFGLDFATLNRRLADMEIGTAAVYGVDLLRIGAFLLMTLALKGFVLFVANIGYTVAIILAGTRARKLVLVAEHSVHSQGPLSAFSTHKRTSDLWPHSLQYDSPFERGAQINRAFADSEDVSIRSLREAPNEFSGRSFDRSNSWHHSRSGVEGRPFSYLEEQQGRPEPRDPWGPPPRVPAPDYSPPAGKRLKSALKPAA